MESFDIESYIGDSEVEHLYKSVELRISETLRDASPYLGNSLNNLFKSRAKRFRPALLIGIAAGGNSKSEDLLVASCVAIELIHLGSLIHDDIIDNASVRRGKPTINSHQGLAQAIVSGDYLLAKACQQAAAISPEVALIISSTIAKMADGQSREIASTHKLNRSVEDYLESITLKTATLVSAVCQIGGLCAGLDANQIKKLADYGNSLGKSFQIIDDLLDYFSTDELLGKLVGKDLAGEVFTLPIILALNTSERSEVEKKIKNGNLSAINKILIDSGSVSKSVLQISKFNLEASKSINGLRLNKNLTTLANLPEVYFKWTMKNKIAEEYSVAINRILN